MSAPRQSSPVSRPYPDVDSTPIRGSRGRQCGSCFASRICAPIPTICAAVWPSLTVPRTDSPNKSRRPLAISAKVFVGPCRVPINRAPCVHLDARGAEISYQPLRRNRHRLEADDILGAPA